jgi:hypothetical protein
MTDGNHLHMRSITISSADGDFTVDRWQAQPPSVDAGRWYITIGNDSEDAFQFPIEDAANVVDAITTLLRSAQSREGGQP